jgi:hypothetical protein
VVRINAAARDGPTYGQMINGLKNAGIARPQGLRVGDRQPGGVCDVEAG